MNFLGLFSRLWLLQNLIGHLGQFLTPGIREIPGKKVNWGPMGSHHGRGTPWLSVFHSKLPWEPKTFIFRSYNPYIGGVKPSFFMVLGSKGRTSWWLDQPLWKKPDRQKWESPSSRSFGVKITNIWVATTQRILVAVGWSVSACYPRIEARIKVHQSFLISAQNDPDPDPNICKWPPPSPLLHVSAGQNRFLVFWHGLLLLQLFCQPRFTLFTGN